MEDPTTRLLALLLCEEVTTDDGGIQTLRGVFDLTLAPSFPMTVPMHVFVKLAGTRPSSLDLAVVNVETGAELGFFGFTMHPGPPSITLHQTYPLTAVFAVPGDYEVRLSVDGAALAVAPWTVRPLTPP